MKLIDQSVKVVYPSTLEEGIAELKKIEKAGRNCWRSEGKITEDSYLPFVKSLIKRGHCSPVEFGTAMFEMTTSRDVMAELTRHRVASFAIESQRYVDESAEDGGIRFIKPLFFLPYDGAYELDLEGHGHFKIHTPDFENKGYNSEYNKRYSRSREWEDTMEWLEERYLHLINMGAKNQDARKVLPNSTACKIMMSVNLRELLHIYDLRSSHAAYPEMRELMRLLKIEVDKVLPGFLPGEEDTDGRA